MTALAAAPVWEALKAHHAEIKDLHLRALFADDPGRAMASGFETPALPGFERQWCQTIPDEGRIGPAAEPGARVGFSHIRDPNSQELDHRPLLSGPLGRNARSPDPSTGAADAGAATLFDRRGLFATVAHSDHPSVCEHLDHQMLTPEAQLVPIFFTGEQQGKSEACEVTVGEPASPQSPR